MESTRVSIICTPPPRANSDERSSSFILLVLLVLHFNLELIVERIFYGFRYVIS